MHDLTHFICLVEFLGQALGPTYEIVLHDLKKPDHSIIAIANGNLSGRSIGGPLTDLALKLLQQHHLDKKPFLVNYHGKSSQDHVFLCSSYFIHDENGQAIAILCINHDIAPYLAARQFLTEEIIKDQPPAAAQRKPSMHMRPQEQPTASLNIFENFQGNVGDVITALINNTMHAYRLPPSRLSAAERQAIVQELDDNGLFLLKGGLPALAKFLSVSEPTIYRYLSKIKKK